MNKFRKITEHDLRLMFKKETGKEYGSLVNGRSNGHYYSDEYVQFLEKIAIEKFEAELLFDNIASCRKVGDC